MYVRAGSERRLSTQELMLSNCGTGEDLRVSLGLQETKSANPKGNQPWIFTKKNDDDAEAPILWPPDVKSQLIGKDLDAGKDWRQKEKAAAEGEMVRQHHQLNGHELEQTRREHGGQGSLSVAVHGVAKSQTWLSNWIATTTIFRERWVKGIWELIILVL